MSTASLEQERFHADMFGCAFTVTTPWDPNGLFMDPFEMRAVEMARRLCDEPYDGPLSLEVSYYIPHPPSHYGPRGNVFAGAPKWHSVKPSILEMTGPLLEALEGVLWRRPQQLFSVSLEKYYGLPARARIRVKVRA